MTFRNLQYFTLFSLSLLIVLIIVAACGNKNQQAVSGPPPVQVVTQQVRTTSATYYDEYPAIVKALNEVELRPQVNGYITGIHFREGDHVSKGQKLYSLDQQQYEAQYQQSLANLSVQEANLERAKKDVDRYRELDKANAIAKQQVDYAEATYAAAQKQVDAAKAAVQSVQTNVRYSTITAPFDGTIGISLVRLGASVSPGQTLLNTISSDDPIAVDITIDQKEIYRFTKLQAEGNSSRKNDSTFRLALGTELYPIPGKISIIDRAVDPQTGTIKVRITFSNPQHLLRPGMSAQLRIANTVSKSVVIPYKSIVEQLGEFFVYVTHEGDKVTQRKIQLGKQVGRDILVRDGLKEGDTIVVEGVQNLREGSSIATAKPEEKKQAVNK